MIRVLFLALVLAAMLPATATAQQPQSNAPAGNSAIEEYLETIPGSTGDQSAGNSPGAGSGSGAGDATSSAGGSGASALTPAQRARIDRVGPDGNALADVVDATAPPRVAKPTPEPVPTPSGDTGRSGLGQVIDAASGRAGGDGGMGIALPAILGTTLLGALGLIVARRRSML